MSCVATIAAWMIPGSFGTAICRTGDPCCVRGRGVLSTVAARTFTQSRMGYSRRIPLGPAGGQRFGIGGWSLSGYHMYEPTSKLLMRGDGGASISGGRSAAAAVIAGRKSDGSWTTDAPTSVAEFSNITEPTQIAAGADGTVYFSATGDRTIWRIKWQGGLERIFDSGIDGVNCKSWISDMAVHDRGALYVACDEEVIRMGMSRARRSTP